MGWPTVNLQLTSEDGLVGWGQSVPTPKWSHETPESVAATINLYLRQAGYSEQEDRKSGGVG